METNENVIKYIYVYLTSEINFLRLKYNEKDGWMSNAQWK